MDEVTYDNISPYVRMMRIKKAVAMSGEWRDLDNVFTYIAQGSAEFVVDGIRYVCETGDMILIPPLKTHIVKSLGSQLLVQFIFHFDLFERPESHTLKHRDVLRSELEFEVVECEKIYNNQVLVLTLNDKERYEIKNTYLGMYREFMGNQTLRDVMLKAYATVILGIALRNCYQRVDEFEEIQSKSKNKPWIHIENAIDYINTYWSDHLDNDSISTAIAVTPNYLTNVFRNYLGMPLHKYIIHVKIEKAQQLLNSGNMNITEVAEKSGFSSIHAFSKTFKSVVGMNPSEYMNYLTGQETLRNNIVLCGEQNGGLYVD